MTASFVSGSSTSSEARRRDPDGTAMVNTCSMSDNSIGFWPAGDAT
jgi:hypothetical protein